MNRKIILLSALTVAISSVMAGCGNQAPDTDETKATTSFDELASYYDDLAKGEIAVEIETTSDVSQYYEFTGDKNLFPDGVFAKLEHLVKTKYENMYSKYGISYNCPKITLIIDAGYIADSPCHANEKNIYINPNWFADHSEDCDALLSTIFQTMQEYQSDYPEWIASSIAACVREEYGSDNPESKWKIPYSYEGKSYEEGDVYGASFLKWINSNLEKDFIYRLNKTLQNGAYNESFWETETGHTFGQLWTMYKEA